MISDCIIVSALGVSLVALFRGEVPPSRLPLLGGFDQHGVEGPEEGTLHVCKRTRLRDSSRSLPLKDAMNPFSTGRPG